MTTSEIVLLLTRREAARALRISERQLWTLTNSGKLPCVRLGHCVRYALDDLRAFIEAQKSSRNELTHAAVASQCVALKEIFDGERCNAGEWSQVASVHPSRRQAGNDPVGKISQKKAEALKIGIEQLVSATTTGLGIDEELARWVAKLDPVMLGKLAAVNLVAKRENATLSAFVDLYSHENASSYRSDHDAAPRDRRL